MYRKPHNLNVCKMNLPTHVTTTEIRTFQDPGILPGGSHEPAHSHPGQALMLNFISINDMEQALLCLPLLQRTPGLESHPILGCIAFHCVKAPLFFCFN